MAAHTLTDLYVEELRDLYSAERQILKALPKMVKAATNQRLKDAFESHREKTEEHVQRLEAIFEELGKSQKGKTCHGMEGVLEEGADLIEEEPDPPVLDAGLISAAQHVEHYEMAGYGSARTWAEQLGFDNHVSLLHQTLDVEKEADEALTRLAEQSVNLEAERETEVSRAATRMADTAPKRSSSTPRSTPEKRPRPTA